MNIIHEAFDLLEEVGGCRTQAEFSREFLDQSEHYFAYLKSTNSEASARALRHLGQRMIEIGSYLRHMPNTDAAIREHGEAIFSMGVRVVLTAIFGALERRRAADREQRERDQTLSPPLARA